MLTRKGRKIAIILAFVLWGLGVWVCRGFFFIESGHMLSPTMPIRTDATVEDAECKGTVLRIEKTPHGIVVVVVDIPKKGRCGAIVSDELKVGEACTVVWVDHYGNAANPMHGDYFAVKVTE